MMIWLLLFAIQDNEFKNDMRAVELLKQSTGEWTLVECYSEGKEEPFRDWAFSKATVSKEGNIVLFWPDHVEAEKRCIAFDPKLNAFKIQYIDGDPPHGRTGLLTVRHGKLILVTRSLTFGKSAISLRPTKQNFYDVYEKDFWPHTLKVCEFFFKLNWFFQSMDSNR